MKRIAIYAIAAVAALTASCAAADVVDITDVVRLAGKGTTKLTKGENATQDYTTDNAFGKTVSFPSRVLLKGQENDITYSIADDFCPGEEIVVTSYTIRRTICDARVTTSENQLSRQRAPVSFALEGSTDGETWKTIDKQTDLSWETDTSEMEKVFAVDAANFGSYRHYRFRTFKTNVSASEPTKCGFQYIALKGWIGERVNFGEAVLGGVFATRVEDVVPAFDSMLEFDFSFNSISGTQGIFSNGYNDETKKFRLFLTDAGWQFDYGTQSLVNPTKPTVDVRYKVVVNGPVVTLNGKELFDAGEKLADPGTRGLSLFSAFGEAANPDKLNYPAKVTVRGVKVWDADGNLQLELRPGMSFDGSRAFVADEYGVRSYSGKKFTDLVRGDFSIHPSEVDLVAKMRTDGAKPTVSLGENTTLAAGTTNDLFSSGRTNNDRFLLKEEATTVDFAIPADYKPGEPFVLTRFVVVPCIGGNDSALDISAQRCPAQFKLLASADGVDWTTLYEQAAKLPEAAYKDGAKMTVGSTYGYAGVSFEIPEENRGDYRRYRLVTTATNRGVSDTGSRWGVQELKLYGVVGGVGARCDPIEYVQNGTDDKSSNMTYFRTGVQPPKADMTIELKGEFTRVDQTMGLFCCRGASGANAHPWVCWLNKGKLRLDSNSSSSESSFAPEANVPYTITIKANELYVNGSYVYPAAGSADFTPGSEIVLMASHNNYGNWDNQACFKLKSCKIIDAYGGAVRDYVPVKNTADGKGALYDRVTGGILAASGTAARTGEVSDIDFRQRGRAVALATELVDGALPRGPLTFAFEGNQVLQGTLYAAFGNGFAGTEMDDWAEAVELGTLKNGVATMTVDKLKVPNRYPCVKFFVRDGLGDVSYTRSYGTGLRGTVIIVR